MRCICLHSHGLPNFFSFPACATSSSQLKPLHARNTAVAGARVVGFCLRVCLCTSSQPQWPEKTVKTETFVPQTGNRGHTKRVNPTANGQLRTTLEKHSTSHGSTVTQKTRAFLKKAGNDPQDTRAAQNDGHLIMEMTLRIPCRPK